MRVRSFRLLVSAASVAVLTAIAHGVIPLNAPTVGFMYLLLVLIIASTWGFPEAGVASVLATVAFNFYFLPPIGTLTIADPENWVALFSFLVTSLIASRLSTIARRRALDAINRQKDLERLYSFSRAILLIDNSEPFAKQLAQKLAAIFGPASVALLERASGQIYRAGPAEFNGIDEQLHEAAFKGTSFSNPDRHRVVTAVRLGSEPIASLGIQDAHMPDAVLQGIANLVAIGLERSRAQDLAHQIEAARQTEQLRTTLIDSMAHELKTPLTSILAATTSLLSDPSQSEETKQEFLKIAGEEAEHLKDLIEDAVEMARLDTAQIEVRLEPAHLDELVHQVLSAIQLTTHDHRFDIIDDGPLPEVPLDARLIKLALKQLLDNALKYSLPGTSITIQIKKGEQWISVAVANQGTDISPQEQTRIFERFYRSPSVQSQVPGSGLGLSIAHRIAEAHSGNLTVSSAGGKTTFELTLPLEPQGELT